MGSRKEKARKLTGCGNAVLSAEVFRRMAAKVSKGKSPERERAAKGAMFVQDCKRDTSVRTDSIRNQALQQRRKPHLPTAYNGTSN